MYIYNRFVSSQECYKDWSDGMAFAEALCERNYITMGV